MTQRRHAKAPLAGQRRTDTHVVRELQIGIAALESRFRETLRQELGVTYSPSGEVVRDTRQPGFCFASLELTFPSDHAIKLAERSLKIADQFAQKGLSRDEFDRAIEPLRSNAAANLASNDWWRWNVLLYAQSQPEVIDDARSLGTAFDRITLDDVNRVIAAHLRQSNASFVGVIPRPNHQ